MITPEIISDAPTGNVERWSWMDANQLGRRNLTGDQASILRGRRYNRTKKAQGGTGANQWEQSGQNVRSANTAETLAKQHGVTERTIRRDGKMAQRQRLGSHPIRNADEQAEEYE